MAGVYSTLALAISGRVTLAAPTDTEGGLRAEVLVMDGRATTSAAAGVCRVLEDEMLGSTKSAAPTPTDGE